MPYGSQGSHAIEGVDLEKDNYGAHRVQQEHGANNHTADMAQPPHLAHPNGVAHQIAGQQPLLECRSLADQQQYESADYHEAQPTDQHQHEYDRLAKGRPIGTGFYNRVASNGDCRNRGEECSLQFGEPGAILSYRKSQQPAASRD